MKIQSRHGILAILVTIFIFPSCLKLTTEIRLNADGTVDSQLIYVLKNPLESFEDSWDAEELWPIPLNEEYFMQRAITEKNTELVSYRLTKFDNDSEKIVVSLKSASVDSLARYLGIDLVHRRNEEGDELILTLPSSSPSAELAAIWRQKGPETLLKDSVFTIRVFTDKKIRNISAGTSTGKSAELELSLFDALMGDVMEEWVVSWF